MAQAWDGSSLLDRRVGVDREGDRAAHGRLGNHLAVHAPPRAGGDGCAGRPGGGRARAVPARLRHIEDLSQQRPPERQAHAGADARRRRDRARSARGQAVHLRGRHVERGRARPAGRSGDSARRSSRLCRGNRSEDAGARGRDRGRLPDAVHHDAPLRPLHARERRGGHRHRLHDRRVDPRVGSRGRSRRRA